MNLIEHLDFPELDRLPKLPDVEFDNLAPAGSPYIESLKDFRKQLEDAAGWRKRLCDVLDLNTRLLNAYSADPAKASALYFIKESRKQVAQSFALYRAQYDRVFAHLSDLQRQGVISPGGSLEGLLAVRHEIQALDAYQNIPGTFDLDRLHRAYVEHLRTRGEPFGILPERGERTEDSMRAKGQENRCPAAPESEHLELERATALTQAPSDRAQSPASPQPVDPRPSLDGMPGAEWDGPDIVVPSQSMGPLRFLGKPLELPRADGIPCPAFLLPGSSRSYYYALEHGRLEVCAYNDLERTDDDRDPLKLKERGTEWEGHNIRQTKGPGVHLARGDHGDCDSLNEWTKDGHQPGFRTPHKKYLFLNEQGHLEKCAHADLEPVPDDVDLFKDFRERQGLPPLAPSRGNTPERSQHVPQPAGDELGAAGDDGQAQSGVPYSPHQPDMNSGVQIHHPDPEDDLLRAVTPAQHRDDSPRLTEHREPSRAQQRDADARRKSSSLASSSGHPPARQKSLGRGRGGP
jgi:hypothetical protein